MVYVELEQDFDMDEVRTVLENAPGIVVKDDPSSQVYPMAVDCAGKTEVFIGRLRRDLANPRGLNMWV